MKMRILIAEDDPVSRHLLRKAVERLGHHCFAAEDGARAWRIYESREVDVVISDRMMPGLDGLELCERVRARREGHYTYFILLTALAEKAHRLEGVRAGADDYLTKPLDPDELEIALITAHRMTALYRLLAEQTEQLRQLNDKLFAEGRRDPLTGIANRLQMQEDLVEIQSRIERYGDRYCLALFDIDLFKRYNDTCGHVAGDEALRAVAAILSEQIRSSDKIYRYGGEEFLVALPGQSLDQAVEVVDRVRRAVEARAIPHPGRGPGSILTVSAGVARFEGGKRSAIDETLQEADQALYRAKEAGRNRVAVQRPPPRRDSSQAPPPEPSAPSRVPPSRVPPPRVPSRH